MRGKYAPSKKLLPPGRWRARMVGQESEEEKRKVPATSPESHIPSGHPEPRDSMPGAPPCPCWASRPGVQMGSEPLFPNRPRAVRRGWGCAEGPSRSRARGPTGQWQRQICVSCTFSLEPLLKSRGSWMELRPGGPLPPQPPLLGLLL